MCHACAWCLSWKQLRNYSIIATASTLSHPDKSTIRARLVNPPEPPFIFVVAVSGQKWLHFKSVVNFQRGSFIVMLEETPVKVNSLIVGTLLDVLAPMLDIFSKSEIQTGRYNQNRIKQMGLSLWKHSEDVIRKWRGAAIFELALHVAQKRDEEEAI
jgi:hypothetical protein